MRSPSVRDALLLGVVQGPTELLPVSSSAHIALASDALGTARPAEEDELEKVLEIALHGGAGAALLIAGRGELARTAREMTPRRFVAGVLAAVLPATAGYLLERFPAARLSGRRSIASGLALGGVAMALADRAPQDRELVDVAWSDGLALGVAQALALLPGVSRNGATLTAARARGFRRDDAQALSWRVGLPVIAGATGLRAWRLRGRGFSPEERETLAVGTTAAFASTLASAKLLEIGRRNRDRRQPLAGDRHRLPAPRLPASPLPAPALLPFALYRIVLALLVARAQ